MNVTINGESYNTVKVHEFFSQGRRAIKAHGITDEHGYINKALYFSEVLAHLLGSLSYIDVKSDELPDDDVLL